jgi:hypothetical protein
LELVVLHHQQVDVDLILYFHQLHQRVVVLQEYQQEYQGDQEVEQEVLMAMQEVLEIHRLFLHLKETLVELVVRVLQVLVEVVEEVELGLQAFLVQLVVMVEQV